MKGVRFMKWVCSRCGTVNSKSLCSKCRGTHKRYGTPYKKEKSVENESGALENTLEKRYRIISEIILLLHYPFLLIPVISIKGVNVNHTYSALGMLYDLELCVYIFALFALTSITVYLMEIVPKMQKGVMLLALINNLLNFSITPALIIFGAFTGFTLTFGGVLYILFTVLGFVSLVLYYRIVFDGAVEETSEDDAQNVQENTKKYIPKTNSHEYLPVYSDDEKYKPIIDIKIDHDFVSCPMCGKKVRHGTTYCPTCNTLLLRKAPSRDIRSNSGKRKNKE